MVERIKIAIEKARAQRGGAPVRQAPAQRTSPVRPLTPERPKVEPAVTEQADGWDQLQQITFDPKHLERNRVISHARVNPAHVVFDVLRTRILRVFKKHGWTRLGITSPSKGCGKTFVSVNLAFSLSRHADCRAVLIDMDLRAPRVAKVLGVEQPEPISWFLTGDVAAENYLRKEGDNLAVGLNAERVRDASEMILDPNTAASLSAMQAKLSPNIVVYDLPPILNSDDVIGFLPQLDCVLLVVGGGVTKASEVTECERLLADQTHLLGVLLNKAEGVTPSQFRYEDG